MKTSSFLLKSEDKINRLVKENVLMDNIDIFIYTNRVINSLCKKESVKAKVPRAPKNRHMAPEVGREGWGAQN